MRPWTWLLSPATLVIGLACGGQGADPPAPGGEGVESADPDAAAEGGGKPMTPPADDLEGLAAGSPFIFVGKVVAATPEMDRRGMIVTRNKFAVERVVVGDPATKDVTLTTLGGTIGERTLTASGMPAFAPERSYFVFTDLARTTYNPVTGNRRGVFRVERGVVYSYEGYPIVAVEEGRVREGDAAAELPGDGKARERGAVAADDPTTTGSIVSVRRADEGGRPGEEPMRLDDFVKAVQDAARR
ncbi:hypothetical protein [Paludisphaera soli]|uniref:hypothetical protein n=1 Tax=Paludisphaera soli TaxID=2712865 RepID=UPI0013ECADB2|nr:hypothetical protein [Paludisphaera soli]